MKKGFIRGLGLGCIAAVLLSSVAMAESISFNGQVTAKTTQPVYASIGGTVESVSVEAGQYVKADDVLATLRTAKVYATEDGTVTGIFAQPGDAADSIAERFGAVMYVESDAKYTVSASIENAYNSAETKYVHAGEKVYLVSRSDGSRNGMGTITSVEQTSYTVQVESGTFLLNETVDVYRGQTQKAANRVGRGTIARKTPMGYTGTGSVVRFVVQDGQKVSRGDLLFETADGSFDGLYMSGMDLYCNVEGVVASVKAEQGSAVQKDGVVATIYPKNAMRIEAQVSEEDLCYVSEDDQVLVELNWNQDQEITYEGVISMISGVASEGESVQYTVYIDFTPDEHTRYGMSAVISTLEEAEEEADELAQ